MHYLSIAIATLGVVFIAISIVRFSFLLLKSKTIFDGKPKGRIYYRLFYVYLIILFCFYLGGVIYFIFENSKPTQNVLAATCFLLYAIFIYATIINLKRRIIIIENQHELEKRFKQQELMSAIAISFTSSDDYQKHIHDALELSGKFMNVNHSFLSRYQKNKSVLQCIYEWYDGEAKSFIEGERDWPIYTEMEIYKDLVGNGYAAINDYNLLTDLNFQVVKDYQLRAFLNIPIEVNGEFWGILGFIIYHHAYDWNESDIHLGRLIAGIFSGTISRNIANEQLIEAKEAAENANKSKSDFLSRMSHEMRTPMNMIIGMSNIGRNAAEIGRKNYCFDKVNLASKHLLGVINDILDMSKIEANKFNLLFGNVNLETAIGKIVDIITYQVEEKKQQFSLNISSDVPKVIVTDELRICQVLANLLSNAVKFTPEKGAISLSIRRIEDGQKKCILQFEVKDTGIGISKEKQEKLFQPFEQADGKITRKYGGTGLGLVISKRIIELLGGKIWIESTVGVGSKFIFNIEVDIVTRKEEVNVLEKNHAVKDSFSNCFENFHILVAEDIELNQEIFAALLEQTGIRIEFANNGKEVYEKFILNSDKYSLIFMDIHMPEVDGYQATNMIRTLKSKKAKSIPIIAMTADVFREDVERCLASGMNDHVSKPLDFDIVKEKIAQYCR